MKLINDPRLSSSNQNRIISFGTVEPTCLAHFSILSSSNSCINNEKLFRGMLMNSNFSASLSNSAYFFSTLVMSAFTLIRCASASFSNVRPSRVGILIARTCVLLFCPSPEISSDDNY